MNRPMEVSPEVPSYLSGYEELYAKDPREAALAWFQDAKFGLFIHYGLYSLLGRGEWVMYHDKIRVAEYEKLKDKFTAENFDAEFIADLAVDAGMKYINITTRHHDSFCLFQTKETDFHSLNSAAKRDLIGELAEACSRRGLGLFLYYSYGADWRHPYFYSRDVGFETARPAYDEPEPTYLYRKEEDFRHYIDFCHNQIRELLTQYGPIAGIWLDLIMACYYRPDLYPVHETYSVVRELQPQCLISFKQGITGDEDFMSQEMSFTPVAPRLAKRGAPPEVIARSERAWEIHKNKWNEVCTILQHKGWGYVADTGHRTADEVMDMLKTAASKRCNLLANVGPLPDGSIHPEDLATLREVGRRIRAHGYPSPDSGVGAEADSPITQTDTGAAAE